MRRSLCLLLWALASSGCSAVSAAPEPGPHRPEPSAIPRLPPVEADEWTSEQRAYLEPYEQTGRLFNVFKTAAHHPELAQAFDFFVYNHILGGSSTLPPRHRELLILRIGWLCQSEYEWAQHSRVGKSLGLTEEEVKRVALGPDAPGWTPFEADLLRAVDELHERATLTDATWQALSSDYTTQQLIDVVFAVGTYNLVSMALNSWGVQLDEGLIGFPELD